MVHRLRTLLLAMALGMLAAGTPGARADQNDARLDDLFERLQASADAFEASLVERMIWAIWFTYEGDDEAVSLAMRQGAVALDRGDAQAAEAAFDHVVETAPDFAEGWNRRATVRYLRGDYAGSVADIQATLALEPRHFGALSGLGLCYMALDRPEEALAAFAAALEVNPHLSGVKVNIEILRERLAGEPI